MKKSTTKMPASFMAQIRARYQEAIGQKGPESESQPQGRKLADK